MILHDLQQLIDELTGKQNLEMNTDLIRDLELSSFDVMNLICAVEDKYDLTIPTRDVWNLHTVSDIIEYLKIKGVSE